MGRLENAEVDEASGLVASRLDPDLFWVHNDSGDGPRLFAINRNGEQLAELSVVGAEADDWEDIAAGPVLEGSASSLFIGDSPPTRTIQLVDACTACVRAGSCNRLTCTHKARNLERSALGPTSPSRL